LTDYRQSDVFAVAPNGQLRQLSDDRLSSEPAVAPDGSWLVFTKAAEGSWKDWGYEETSLQTMDTDGELIASIPAEDGWNDSAPAISPDGARIAFIREREGGFYRSTAAEDDRKLVVANSDGSQQSVLGNLFDPQATQWPISIGGPAWSDDQSSLAVTIRRDDGTSALRIMDPSNGNIRQTIVVPHGVEGQPVWSPEGDQVLLSWVEATGWSSGMVDLDSGAVSELSMPAGFPGISVGHVDATGSRLLGLSWDQEVDSEPQRIVVMDRAGEVVGTTDVEQVQSASAEAPVRVFSPSFSKCFGAAVGTANEPD
jgi:Tol biopolymer transport system component